MTRKVKCLGTASMAVTLIGLAFSSDGAGHAYAGSGPSGVAKSCPLVLDLNQGITAEVVDVQFTDLVVGIGGVSMRIPDDKKGKFRLGVVTVEITKPVGQRLTLAAADLTLHYYHGDKTEVAPCEGLSSFSTILEVDRPVNLARVSGPGFVKQTTGARSTRAGVVYIDAVFNYMEPDTSDVWLSVGQPTSAEPFATGGYSPTGNG